MNPEQARMVNPEWEKWGPYLTDRQWGTVREDYSAHGGAWEFISHEMARSKAYRWGDEGIGGICDDNQLLCFALAFWNKKDPILKERYFGLTGNEGNHGEDVKEYYYYLDNTPNHSYMKMLYKYPQQEFPYQQIIQENRKRTLADPEYELIDTGIFNEDNYFDVFIEYAKNNEEDILICITAHNHGKQDAALNIVPTIWFRNTWAWGYNSYKPKLSLSGETRIKAEHAELGNYFLDCNNHPEIIFTENETNHERLYGLDGKHGFFKDGINEYIVSDDATAVCKENAGTKAAANYDITVKAGASQSIWLRLHALQELDPFLDFQTILESRILEADAFYAKLQQNVQSEDARLVQRQAYAGLLWSKQYYYLDINQWIKGDPASPPPPPGRHQGRNHEWKHLNNADIISMPDKWEYPWFAAWDLCIPCGRFCGGGSCFCKKTIAPPHERMVHASKWSVACI